MLYGWLEVGLSNNTLFKSEVDQDIVLRTIYNNKIIFGNTDGINADAAVYIQGNNVGIKKIPETNVSLDVNGFCIFKSAQVGLSNLPTSLSLNGEFIIKDQSKSPSQVVGEPMQFNIKNSNEILEFNYNNSNRVTITNGNGIKLNDNVYVMKDIFANTFNMTSDIRFKTDIIKTNQDKDVETLQNLKVRDFEFTQQPGRKFKGFIAQEVEEIFPQVIVEKTGYTPDKILTTDIRTIDTNQILALNTSVIQNLLKRISALEAKISGNQEIPPTQNCTI